MINNFTGQLHIFDFENRIKSALKIIDRETEKMMAKQYCAKNRHLAPTLCEKSTIEDWFN